MDWSFWFRSALNVIRDQYETTGGSSIRYQQSTTAGEPGTYLCIGDLYLAAIPEIGCLVATDEWFHWMV